MGISVIIAGLFLLAALMTVYAVLLIYLRSWLFK